MATEVDAVSERYVKILVIESGWVLVGYWHQVGDMEILEGARCVTRWGTTKGIGELVPGPTSETRLDLVGEAEVPTRRVLFRIPCDLQGWEEHLG